MKHTQCWPVLDFEMKRFLNFRKKSKIDYTYSTGEDLREPERARKFWQRHTNEELKALEMKTRIGLQDAVEKERSYTRLLSAQLENLEKQRESELAERHLLAVVEENRDLLQEREDLKRRIEKEIKAGKARMNKQQKRATGGEDGELDTQQSHKEYEREEEKDNTEDQEKHEDDPNHPANQDCHAYNHLLNDFFGSEEEAMRKLQKFEKEILSKINQATNDLDLKRIKSAIVAKQSVLLYALSLVEVMRFTKNYPGLNLDEESNEEESTMETPSDDSSEKKRKQVAPLMLLTNDRLVVNKPEPTFRWNNTQTLESWDEETEVELFRPLQEEFLETDV